MKDYKVVKSFKGSRTGAVVEEFAKGDTVELDGDLEEIAVAEKWVEPVKASKSVEQIELSRDRLIELVEAVGLLDKDNKKHWTKLNAPECTALGEITGDTVSAAERDVAWKYVQENS